MWLGMLFKDFQSVWIFLPALNQRLRRAEAHSYVLIGYGLLFDPP
jgi:hypothetical protein